jgi:hypothetical protein
VYRALVVPGKGGRNDLQANPEVFIPSTETRVLGPEVTDPTLPGKASKLQLL